MPEFFERFIVSFILIMIGILFVHNTETYFKTDVIGGIICAAFGILNLTI